MQNRVIANIKVGLFDKQCILKYYMYQQSINQSINTYVTSESEVIDSSKVYFDVFCNIYMLIGSVNIHCEV